MAAVKTTLNLAKIRDVQFPQFLIKLAAVFKINSQQRSVVRQILTGARIRSTSAQPDCAPRFPPPSRRLDSSRETCSA
jgi:hypothetical protein